MVRSFTLMKAWPRVTKSDPLAMSMYAIAIMPLIRKLDAFSSVTQVWFADDATAGGKLEKAWWEMLLDGTRPDFGYHPNATKSWLIMKEESLEQAAKTFHCTGVQVTSEGHRHLACGTCPLALL